MKYDELNSLFDTLATAMGLSYENGPKDQLNTVLREVNTKYPICYSLPFIQLGNQSSETGPEFLNYDLYDVQIAFLDIDGTTKRTPDTNNEEKRSIISAQFVNAKTFLFNLYEGELSGLIGSSILKWDINPLTIYQGMNGGTGALLEFKIKTLSTFDCDLVVI